MRIIGTSALDRTEAFKKREFPDLTAREYRVTQGYDAAAALLVDGTIVAAAAQERFSRKKATCAFPADAIRYCLTEGGLSVGDVDLVAHGFSYGPVREHFQHDEVSRRRYDQVYSPDVQVELLASEFPGVDWGDRFVPVPHHLAHAASAYYPSGFEDALVVVTDGMGEVDSMTALVASPDGLEVVRTIPALHSLGVLYGVFTLHLGFYMGLDEYKVMGLAPYGDASRYFDDVMQFIRLRDDGTYALPLLAENRTLLDKETHRGVLRVLGETFGPARQPEAGLEQHHMDLAAAVQSAVQACQLHLLRTLQSETGQENLCLAGGVALNCTMNGVIRRSRLFANTFIQPAAGDDGVSVGAALYAHADRTGRAPLSSGELPLWGPSYSDPEIRAVIDEYPDCDVREFGSLGELADETARLVADGKIIAWFDGRMEFGPRALGSRSILADPRAPDMRERVNERIKKREGFRPFAPAVVAGRAAEFFEIPPGTEATYAHMLYVEMVRPEYRDALPAITHVDGSARVQTVDRSAHPRFWAVLDRFGEITGIPVVLNTSFNVRGQPIVCTPREAMDTFLSANLDALVMGGCVVERAAVGAGIRVD